VPHRRPSSKIYMLRVIKVSRLQMLARSHCIKSVLQHTHSTVEMVKLSRLAAKGVTIPVETLEVPTTAHVFLRKPHQQLQPMTGQQTDSFPHHENTHHTATHTQPFTLSATAALGHETAMKPRGGGSVRSQCRDGRYLRSLDRQIGSRAGSTMASQPDCHSRVTSTRG
jgi:hypothetical protein